MSGGSSGFWTKGDCELTETVESKTARLGGLLYAFMAVFLA